MCSYGFDGDTIPILPLRNPLSGFCSEAVIYMGPKRFGMKF